MAHRLDPLLRPQSIAVVGATTRDGSVGSRIVRNLQAGRFPGPLYAVNQNHQEVHGVPCYPTLRELPEPVEHVIFAVGDPRIEEALDAAVAHGVRAVTIMSSLILESDRDPPLKQRIHGRVREAGLLVCGGNTMGFYNFRERVWAGGFDTRSHTGPGNVALISHSGSGMSGIVDVEERIDFSLAVSTGQELAVRMDEYLDFALEQPGTRAVGLFIETTRNPQGMIAALEKANALAVPVVAIKVGRTELAARLGISHSGAMAGRDSAYDALFERYGVQRVSDMDELATALIMFAQPHPVGEGALVSLHDSGGERQLTIDLADRLGVPLAELSEATLGTLEGLLDPGLPAVNPLDAWSVGGPDSDRVMEECLAAMMADPAAAAGAVIHDRGPHSSIYSSYIDYLRTGHAASGKPVFLVAARQGTGSDPQVISVTREGFPVLDGLIPFLTGVRCLFDDRDFRARAPVAPPRAPAGAATRWRRGLAGRDTLDEAESAALLADFGLPTNPCRVISSAEQAVRAARDLGFPVVLKTTAAGIAHKTEVGGVMLDLGSEAALVEAYRDLAARLGPRALIAPMIAAQGMEMILGMVCDEQFGPIIMLGFGGVHAEGLGDCAFALPPFDAAAARRRVDTLRMARLLRSRHGSPAYDLDAYCKAAARLSVLATELGGAISEIDINPIILKTRGCIAVDALVVTGAGGDTACEQNRRVV